MRYRTVIYIKWKLTGRFEIFINLGKLYKKYSDSQIGVSRYTLSKKDLYIGYNNDVVEIFKCHIN
jgi:hypothetical protein